MAIKVLALASGVTGLADHRVLNGSMMTSAGTLQVRGGVLPGAGSGALSTVSAMVARVAPVKVLIPNGVSSALGPYLLVSDANVDITFDAGEASVPRVDRIIARAYDNSNDGSGQTTGSIYYLKGQASGSATALPTNSILLYEMTVPAGASSGGGGINFANAVDQRVYTVAQGGVFPVASNTEMAAITSPYEGMTVYRTDLDVLYVYDGTNFKARGVPSVAASANLTNINNPYDGLLAVTRDSDAIWVYNGTTWVQPKLFLKPVVRLVASGTQSMPDNTATALFFSAADEIDTHGFHNPSVNNTRITPTVAGIYRFHGSYFSAAMTSPSSRSCYFRKNGTTVIAPGPRDGGESITSSQEVTALIECNGTTDYVELMGQQDSSGAVNTAQSAQQSSVFECEFVSGTTY
jgi:hypothetical protein